MNMKTSNEKTSLIQRIVKFFSVDDLEMDQISDIDPANDSREASRYAKTVPGRGMDPDDYPIWVGMEAFPYTHLPF